MKPALATAFLFALCVNAAEEIDRAAIRETIQKLNAPVLRGPLFTTDFEDFGELAKLRIRVFQLPPSSAENARPRVEISNEPWGEATWTVGPADIDAGPNRIEIVSIRFVTGDVALVNARASRSSGAAHSRVFLVVKREKTGWLIASLHQLENI